MPPPVSYVDISAVPFTRTVTQAEFNVASEFWFRFIAARPLVLGLVANKGGTFTPTLKLYESDGSTLVRTVNGYKSFWTVLEAGTYFIQATRFGGGTSDFDVRVMADTRPLDDDVPIPSPATVINDDEPGFPATVLNTAGEIVGFSRVVPAGEIGAALPNGVTLWHDRYGLYAEDALIVVDADLHHVATVDIGLTTRFPSLTAVTAAFYAVDPVTKEVYRITPTGVATLAATLSTADDISAIAVDEAETTLFWVNGRDHDKTIHRHDLATDAPLADLYTLPSADTIALAKTPNGHPGDLIWLPDGSLVTTYINETDDEYGLIQVSDAGVLLVEHVYDPDTDEYAYLNHLSRASTDGSGSVLAWWLRAPYLDAGRFAEVILATGAQVSPFTTAHSSASINLVHEDDTLFPPSASCTFLRLLSPGAVIGPIAWCEWTRTGVEAE